MEIDHGSKSSSGGSNLLKGCAIVAAMAIVGLIVLLVYLVRMPTVQSIMKCRMNMVAVGDAIGRYHDATGAYPADLHAIEKEYLTDRSVLRCPLDKSKDNKPSYAYHRPGANSGDRFIMLECNRHRFGKEMPVSKLMLLKDGTIEMEKPDLKQTAPEKGGNKK